MSVFIPTQPPTSVPTAADLATPSARTGDGFVVSTTGQETPGDNGAAAYIYHMTGRSGQVMDSGAYRAGPGIDDWWEVTKKDVLNLSIYPIDNTGIVDDGYLPLTNDVPGETLLVNEGVYLIASNYTLNRRVQFEYGARFKIANGFNVHLAAGYVAEPTQWVFDVSDGGTVTVDNMPGVSVAHWGAVPDFVSPSTGTNSSPMIQAAFDACQGIAASKGVNEPMRPEVFVPPGSYRLDTGVILRGKCNLYAVGANFFYWGSMASDGAILTIGEYTGAGSEIELGTFFCPTVTGRIVGDYLIPQANEEFVGIRVDSCGSSVFHMEGTIYVPIGLQLRPNTKSYVAHNHFLNHKSYGYRVAIDFVWRWDQTEDNFGWSNENVFTNCNATTDSSSRYIGSTIGTRFRCTNTRVYGVPGWDFGGCNNNRFYGHCYQPAYLADSPGGFGDIQKLTIGKVVVQNRRYVNYSTRQEYICDVAGTVATVPTNVDNAQSPADFNGVRFTHIGPYMQAGVLIDKAGAFNLWHACRWEYGDGAFCYIANSSAVDINVCRGNEIVLYDYARQNTYLSGKVLIDDWTLARKNTYAGFRNTARIYGQDFNDKQVISDLHKRFVASATGLCMRGMAWFNWSSNTVEEYSDFGMNTWKLFKNALYEKSGKLLGVVVDLEETKRIGAYNVNYGPTSVFVSGVGQVEFNTTSVAPLNSENDGVSVALSTTNDCVSNGGMADSIWAIGGEPIYFGLGSNANISRAFLGTGGGYGSISTHLELHTVQGGWVNHSILSSLTPDTGRFSTSTPTGGFFLERNEFIRHYTTEVFTSSGWRVRTPGILAQAWATGIRVEETELRSNAGNVYAALAGGTTGATPPTGTGASFSDGTINWEWIAVEAELEEVYEGAAVPVGNPPITGNLSLRSDESSSSYYKANTYISEKTLTGDFDISFKVVDNGQSHLFGVTELTAPTAFNNHENFAYGVYWFGFTTVTVYKLAVAVSHTIAGWGNNIVRLVRTGSTLEMYIDDVLIAGATDNAFTTNPVHAMYTAYDTAASEAIIYNDDYRPTYQGSAIVANLEPIQDRDEPEVLASTATPVFRWTIFPGRYKSMVLTANVTAMTFMADEAGTYTIAFTQDSTGGRTVVWPAGIEGVEPDLNLLANETTIFTLHYTGSVWHWQDPVPATRVDVSLVSDGDGANWDLSNTYISNDTLTGDFDITFEMVDRQQLYMVGVTTDTIPQAGSNYLRFKYGVYWLSGTGVTVWQDGVSANHVIATWGNGFVRLIRTGTNIDLYINGTIVAGATNAAFTGSPVRRMYSANANVLSSAVIYGDLNLPLAVGSNLVKVETELPDENGVETVSFSATASFNFAVDRRKNKTMTLTGNATGLVVIAPTPGVYYISLTQDGTGNWTVAWATTINGTAPTMSAGAGTSTLFQIYSNGTALYWA